MKLLTSNGTGARRYFLALLACGASLTSMSCGPPTRAAVGVERSSTGIEAVVFVCDDQSPLTLRIYPDQDSDRSFTVVGSLHRDRAIRVPLTRPSRGWRTEGAERFESAHVYEVDVEGSDESRLGASIYFRMNDVPNNGILTQASDGENNRVVSFGIFAKQIRAIC